MIEGDKSHTSGWGWVWRIDLDRKVQIFFFVMVRNTLKWACLNVFYSNCFLTMFGSGLSSSVEWECWKLPTRKPKSPLPPRLGDSQKWWSNSPGISPNPKSASPANFGTLIKVHFGTLMSALWISSFGYSRLWQLEVVREKPFSRNYFLQSKKAMITLRGMDQANLPPTPNQPPCQFWRSDKSSFRHSHVGSLDQLFRLQALTSGSGRRKTCFTNNKTECFTKLL